MTEGEKIQVIKKNVDDEEKQVLFNIFIVLDCGIICSGGSTAYLL